MAKKKNTQLAVSQEDNTQAQVILEQCHQIASDLHASKDRPQAEAALATINTLPESVQIALVKELSKGNHDEAADILIAIHELAPLKNVRKEARRSLIRLESAKIYPKWEPPTEQFGIMGITTSTNPPRFWKGIVTDSLDIGQVQLLLCWEQGEDYKEIRVLGFLLEFGYDGVKDFFTTFDSKRGVENMLTRMRANTDDVPIKNCSLARGRNLVLKALAVNKQRGTTPHKDYRFNLSLITQLILEAANLDQEDEEEYLEPIDMEGLNAVTRFIDLWTEGEYSQAYDLLSKKSVLREGLSKGEWIERRERWSNNTNLGSLEPNFIIDRTETNSASRKVIEVGWSIEMDKIEEGHTLPELPEATIIYEETGRHWLWAIYTLIQENNEWRIQTIVDKGKSTQELSIAEIEEKVAFYDKEMEKVVQKYPKKDSEELDDEETLEYVRHSKTFAEQAAYYNDILIKKLPHERSNYQRSVDRMLTFSQYERSLAYLIQMTQQFPEDRATDLRLIGEIREELSEQYRDDGNEANAGRNDELREEALLESLKLENSFEAHMSLAEVFIQNEERLDEAKEHLLQAKELLTEPSEEAHIERHLGEIALIQQQFKQALSHYQYLIKQEPQQSYSWSGIAEAYEGLGNVKEAEASYKHAIELDPTITINYWKNGKFYINNKQYAKAIQSLKDGLKNNPDSFELTICLAVAYMESSDISEAEKSLRKAEQITPDTEVVHSLHQMIIESKVEQPRATGRLGKALRQKKMER